MMSWRAGIVVVLLAALAAVSVAFADQPGGPVGQAAATCSDFSTQAEAQRAANTRDPDGDGIYCESLPCPCVKPTKPKPRRQACTRPKSVAKIGFSATKYGSPVV